MCREQLPVWQREWPSLRTATARFVTVAADSDLAATRQFAERHDFPTLVDTENRLARILGYRAIPNGYVFGPDGALLDVKVTNFDLRREGPATLGIVRGWLGRAPITEKLATRPGMNSAIPAALELFAQGDRLLQAGRRDAGLARWHAAFLADPASMVVRKQIWRELYPDRFGELIDLEWQKQQVARENEIGFGAANPSLPAPEI